jgi:signal transduction histidine kinase
MIGDVPHHLKLIHDRIGAIDPSLSDALIHVEQRVDDLQDLMELVENATIMPEIFAERVNLQHLLTEAIVRCLPRPGIEHNSPANDEPLWVYGNSILLRDAFVTLIENACEALDRGGHIQLSVERTSQQAKVVVRDDGPGIPAEYFTRIFEPGFSTKSAPGQIRGKGLFTCRQIIFRHRGHISFESMQGSGTTFYVELPLIGAY